MYIITIKSYNYKKLVLYLCGILNINIKKPNYFKYLVKNTCKNIIKKILT